MAKLKWVFLLICMVLHQSTAPPPRQTTAEEPPVLSESEILLPAEPLINAELDQELVDILQNEYEPIKVEEYEPIKVEMELGDILQNEYEPIKVEMDWGSGFTDTGELYLTGGPALTHAMYQNMDINRRQTHVKSNRLSARQATSVLPQTCAAEIHCDVSTEKVKFLISFAFSIITIIMCLQYRTFDGSCNNLQNPHNGQSETPYKRLEHKKASLINCGMSPYLRLPNPRLASRILMERNESAVDTKNTMMVMHFGQLLDHDIQLTPLRQLENGSFLNCCERQNLNHPDCCPINVPRGDFFYGQQGRPSCMGFIRSKTTTRPGRFCRHLPDIENANTAWIDASFLYGSDEEDAL